LAAAASNQLANASVARPIPNAQTIDPSSTAAVKRDIRLRGTAIDMGEASNQHRQCHNAAPRVKGQDSRRSCRRLLRRHRDLRYLPAMPDQNLAIA
jgi:hypothetical protein